MPSGPSRLDTSYEFDEYGRRIATSETGVSTQKTFVGGMSVQDEVADTGLMMMGHRFYAPDHGRFLNRDPIGFAGGGNLFEYAGGRPNQATDAAGLFWQALVGWLGKQGLKKAGAYLTGAVGGFYGFRGYIEPAWASSMPRENAIKRSLDAVPPEVRDKFARILASYDANYSRFSSPICHQAANDVRDFLDDKFGSDPDFNDFRFSQDRTWHSYLRAPTNYATVSWTAGTPKDEADDTTLYLYAGSDAVYFGIYVPSVSPDKVEPNEWSIGDSSYVPSSAPPRYPAGTSGYWPEFNF